MVHNVGELPPGPQGYPCDPHRQPELHHFLDLPPGPSTLSGVNSDEGTRFRLTLHYDGSGFSGWQLQPRARTVQGEVERAIGRLTGGRRPVVAAGRTDSGVHATGQVATVALPNEWKDRIRELHRGLNALLPGDIWVQELRETSPEFHPRFHATGRSYRYQVGIRPEANSPFHRPWCWPVEEEMEVDLLHRCAALLPGEGSFRAFAKAGQEHRGDRCRVEEAGWGRWEEVGLAFQISANRFLHHMVRYLVGTMVDVARHRRGLEEMVELLARPHTDLVTSPPAPPQGLFLTGVAYAGEEEPESPEGRKPGSRVTPRPSSPLD